MTKLSALLDTCFLISLADGTRPHHPIAKEYFRHMVMHNITMYFSTIAASEFSVKQPITELPLQSFITLPFNVMHAIEAGKLWNLVTREIGEVRHVVRDDVKLISQASREGINFIMTEDERTLYNHCEKLRKIGASSVRAIKLIDGFDISLFSPDGQTDISSADIQPLPARSTAAPLSISDFPISTSPSLALPSLGSLAE